MEIKIENVSCVYKDGELVAIVKRDDKTRKSLVYNVENANAEDISGLLANNEK